MNSAEQREKLINQLIKHEGIRLKPYLCTAGKLTVGVGRNLEDNGITYEEAVMMLGNDINRCDKELRENFAWFEGLDWTRQNVLIDMCFNLGINRLKKFRKTLALIEKGDYLTASEEMLNSRWAVQVKGRAKTLSRLMKDGGE